MNKAKDKFDLSGKWEGDSDELIIESTVVHDANCSGNKVVETENAYLVICQCKSKELNEKDN